MTISIDKSIEQEKGDTTTIRQSPYKINPLILLMIPRSMTGWMLPVIFGNVGKDHKHGVVQGFWIH